MHKLHYHEIAGLELFYYREQAAGSTYNVLVKGPNIPHAGWRNVPEPTLQRLIAYVDNVAAIEDPDLRPFAIAALESALKAQIRA